jgi:hypothetical protein
MPLFCQPKNATSFSHMNEYVISVKARKLIDQAQIEVFSRESEHKPKIEISCSYVSVSSSILIEGQCAMIAVNTNHSQVNGNLKIQYASALTLGSSIVVILP